MSGNGFHHFYGCMILSKYPCRFFELRTPSMMGRSTLFAEPIGGVNGHELIVATSHFESLDSDDIRKE